MGIRTGGADAGSQCAGLGYGLRGRMRYGSHLRTGGMDAGIATTRGGGDRNRSPVFAAGANLIRGWPLGMIDDENFERAFCRHELQSELLLQSGEDVWEGGARI